jgi:ATP-dependent DNA helicase RecG
VNNQPSSSRKTQTLLDQGMGITTHWFPEDISIASLAATLVGMANTRGGTVLLGVAPRSNRVSGIKNRETTVDNIFQAAILADPPLVLPMPREEMIGTDQVLRVTVPEGLPHVYSLEGRYLGRSGCQTHPLPPRKLRELLMERSVIQFENRIPPGATLDDLNPDQVFAYRAALNRPEHESLEDLLTRRGCLRIVDGNLRPTYAALLLFGKDPQRWLPNGSVLAARFPGIAFSDEFIKQEIRGTLPEQIRQTQVFVRDNLRSVARLVGLTRQETSEYPLEAVRELLVNAVAHRDYNLGGDCIHLHIFADRLELHSPGVLTGPVTLENLLVARFSRNAIIAQVLSDLGFVERLGYGLNRVVNVLRQNNLPGPKFEEMGGTFRVTLFSTTIGAYKESHPPDLSRYAKLGFNQRQEMALNYLMRHGRITNRTYQKLCPDISPETLRRDLVDLVKKGELIKVGDKKATYYILK